MGELQSQNPNYTELQNRLLGFDLQAHPRVEISLVPNYPIEDQENLISPTSIAVSTARQCYYSGVGKMKARKTDQDKNIAFSTLEAGHLTTRQHTHFTFLLTGITRHATHKILHSYPFYNTEQQSQRYAKAKEGYYAIPEALTEKQTEHYLNSIKYMNGMYYHLLGPLQEQALEELKIVYPGYEKMGENNKTRVLQKAEKTAQEVARYCLPLGQYTNMYHTLSHLQLIRLWEASSMPNFTPEARYIIAKMVERVYELYPDFLDDMPNPTSYSWGTQQHFINNELPLTKEDYNVMGVTEVNWSENDIQTIRQRLAKAVRLSTGKNFTTEKALELVFNLSLNPELGSMYGISMHSEIGQVLRQVQLSFATKLSHTADSQRQRHRRTPGTNPNLTATYHGADYYTPLLINRGGEGLKQLYNQIMENIYKNYEQATNNGTPDHIAEYLLPNAHNLYLHETGDLFDFLHRIRQRSCYNAQEEIFFITTEQAQHILTTFPEARGILQAPCGVRKLLKSKPICPESERYCGVPVWKLELEDYNDYRNF